MLQAGHLRGPRASALVFLGLLLVALAVRFGPLFREPLLEQGDLAVNALQVRHAKHGRELYGNYSRYEFNHPGPALFYVFAAAEAVLFDGLHVVPAPANAHLVAIVGLQSLWLAAALALLHGSLRWRPWLPLALGAIAAGIWSHPEVMVSVWVPHVIPVPLLCFLVVCTCVGAGAWNRLPLAVLVGGFLCHLHVAQPLYVLSLGAAAAVSGCRSARRAARDGGDEGTGLSRRTLIAALAVALAFALPLVLDVATLGTRSNVAAILGRFWVTRDLHPSLAEALVYFVSYPVASRAQDALFTAGHWPAIREFLLAHGWGIAASVGVLLAAPVLSGIFRRRLEPRERRFFASGSLVLAVAVVDSVIWGRAQTGEIHHYNGYGYYAVYLFAGLLGLGLLAKALERSWRSGLTPLVVLAAAGLLVIALRPAPVDPAESGLAIKRAVDAQLRAEPAGRRPTLLAVTRSNWAVAAAVALELDRRGVEFYVPEWWSFMFQPRHSVARFHGDPQRNLATWWLAAPGPGDETIAPHLSLYTRPASLAPANATIDFTRGGTAARVVQTGIRDGDFIAGRGGDGMTTDERSLWLRFAPQPADSDVRVAFDAASLAGGGRRMQATVYCNGEAVGNVGVGARAIVAVTVPAGVWNRAPVATLEVRFAHPEAERSIARPAYTGWRAWKIWSIRFSESRNATALDAPAARAGGAGPFPGSAEPRGEIGRDPRPAIRLG